MVPRSGGSSDRPPAPDSPQLRCLDRSHNAPLPGLHVRVTSESGNSPNGVGATALGAAEMRAEEAVRPDRLFDDPYAAAFVAAAPPLFPEMASISDDPEIAALKAAFSAGIVVRTRFYDDYLTTACRA